MIVCVLSARMCLCCCKRLVGLLAALNVLDEFGVLVARCFCDMQVIYGKCPYCCCHLDGASSGNYLLLLLSQLSLLLWQPLHSVLLLIVLLFFVFPFILVGFFIIISSILPLHLIMTMIMAVSISHLYIHYPFPYLCQFDVSTPCRAPCRCRRAAACRSCVYVERLESRQG